MGAVFALGAAAGAWFAWPSLVTLGCAGIAAVFSLMGGGDDRCMERRTSRPRRTRALSDEQPVALAGGLRWVEAGRTVCAPATWIWSVACSAFAAPSPKYVEGLPKSRERRDVPVPASLMLRLMASLPHDPDMPLFAEPDGRPFKSAAMTLDVYADLFDEDLQGMSAHVDERVRGLP